MLIKSPHALPLYCTNFDFIIPLFKAAERKFFDCRYVESAAWTKLDGFLFHHASQTRNSIVNDSKLF